MKLHRRSLLLAAALAGAWPSLAQAQAARPKRLGWLSGFSRDALTTRPFIEIVVDALRAKGWNLGENYLIEFRFADGDPSRYQALADELLAWKPDVLYGLETAANVLVTKTRSIPIVLSTSIDPVATGLVQSLARPGTNVTGMVGMTDLLTAKQIELLAELAPRARRIALLLDPKWAGVQSTRRFASDAAQAKGLALEVVPVVHEADVRAAFARWEQERVDGLVVAPTPGTFNLGKVIRQGALGLRLPVVGFVQHGAVVQYTHDFPDQYRQAADFIDAVFRGADPAELPLRKATRFVLSVNLPAAQAIGLKLPQSITLRADKVIE